MIAGLLVGLANVHKTWGFGLCFRHLCNVKGHVWNHKQVHRLYCEPGRNLRIKPRRQLKREKPGELAMGSPEPGLVDGLHGRSPCRQATVPALERAG